MGDNKDEVRPVNPAGVKSWKGVDSFASDNSWYWQPLAAVNISQGRVEHSQWAEKNGKDCKAVLVVNASLTDNQARKRLARNGYPRAWKDRWPVVRVVGGILNTALDKNGNWVQFIDLRSQVRATLLPVGNNGKLQRKHGVLLHCLNPWKLIPKGQLPPGVKPPHVPPPRKPKHPLEKKSNNIHQPPAPYGDNTGAPDGPGTRPGDGTNSDPGSDNQDGTTVTPPPPPPDPPPVVPTPSVTPTTIPPPPGAGQ